MTDADGRYRFMTIKPGAYPWRNHPNAWRPAHIHFSLFGTSFLSRLVTQMYFPNDPLFPHDPIFNSIPDERARQRLISRFDLDLDRAGMGARLPLRHRPARPRLDAVRSSAHERHGPRPIATSSQTVGPFFHFGLTANARLGRCGARRRAGRAHRSCGSACSTAPASRCPTRVIELYQADADGRYPDAEPSRAPAQAFSGFGRLPTGRGRLRACSRRSSPASSGRTAVEQAPHINVCLLARGLLRQVYTRIYFTGDPALATDPILTLVPADRRSTLLAEPSASEPGLWEFVIRLQGDDETVFFDL